MVRIVQPRSAYRAAVITMLSVIIAASVVFLVLRSFGAEEPPQAHQRTLLDVTLLWRCESGHTFMEPGVAHPRTCPFCLGPAHAVAEGFFCTSHGAQVVTVKFAADENGELVMSEWRVGGQAWQPADQALTCPRCGRVLVRKPKDPFEGVVRPKRRENR